MAITDKEVLRQLKIANFYELTESVMSFPEDERDGKSDMDILRDEVSYFLSMFTEGDTVYSDDLEQAREFIRETKNGKVIPCYNTFPPVPKYSPTRLKIELDKARNTINEYNRLKKLNERLRGLQ